MALEEGDVIAMGVMPDPLQWRTWPEDCVSVSEEGKLATQTAERQASLTHTGEELTEGRHYWEVEIAGGETCACNLGVCRPDADPSAARSSQSIGGESTLFWFVCCGVIEKGAR